MSQSPERREAPRESEREERREEERGEERDSRPVDEAGAKLFIANLTYNTRDRDLEDIFEKYGRVKEVHVAEDRDTGRSKGFAFITMSSAKEAADAVDGANGIDLDGRAIKVELSNGGSGGRRDGGRGGDRFGDRGGGGRSDMCYDFQSGRCNRGSSCKFSHDGEGGGGGRDSGRGGDRYGGGDRGGDRYGGGDRGGDRYSSRDSGRDRDYGRDRDSGRDSRGGDRGGDRYSSRDGDRSTRDRSRDRY